MLQRRGIELTPQQIVVDGVAHDTRGALDVREIDRFIARAREHPYVLGTSAAEFARIFSELGREDAEVLAVMTSRKLIQSHDAAVLAARTVAALVRQPVRVRVVDSRSTDLGAGLVTLLGAQARDDGKSLDDTAELLARAAAGGTMRLHVADLDHLIRGGRASFLRGWLARMLGKRPILGFEDGDLAVVQTISTRQDPIEHMVADLAAQCGRRRWWVGISHGAAPDAAARLAAVVKERLDVQMLVVREFSASIYLHVGRGALGCFMLPVDDLGWTPSVPEV